MFEGLPRVSTIWLPNALTKIEEGAIANNPSLTDLFLGGSIQTIEANALQFMSEFGTSVKLKALPSVATNIADNFFISTNENARKEMTLREEWFEEGEHEKPTDLANGDKKWKGIEWKSISIYKLKY